uniref:programmed cell death protein 7 n=1 Tax=Osmia lignaria TaxID=473952 RepID=UPI0014791F07|nr:programmed cell death protein 7 [Osmia lignaria]
MFNDQSFLKGPAQSCKDPSYNVYNQMNQQPIYNTSYNMNMYQNYVYPMGKTFENVNEDPTSLINIEKRQADKQEIEKFLAEVGQSNNIDDQRSKCKKSKIAETKNVMASVYKLNEKLKTICSELKNNQNLTEEEWQEKMNVCNAAKEEIVELLKPITDPNFLSQLNKDLEKRKKKRLREKVKREKWKNEKLMRMENRERMHAQIDLWIRKKQAVIEKEKQEENLRKDADMILFDVRGKRNDARKYLGLLQELQNLRNIKANIARARGEHLSSAADEAFNNIIAKLSTQWSALDREYSIEEQGLKLMLKTDNENRIEKQKKNVFDEWEKVLFGRKITSDQYNTDLPNFIAVRTAWDKYISSDSDASPIPIGWVMPVKPSSAAWQKSLKKETS